MADKSFIDRYNTDEGFKRTMDIQLNSDSYTDSHKDWIRWQLGWIPQSPYKNGESWYTNTIKSVSVATIPNDDVLDVSQNKMLLSTTTGGTTGYVEKPIYIPVELSRAVDVVVDELISKAPQDKIETISKQKYDAKVIELADVINQLGLKTDEYLNALSVADNLKLEIESYKQLIDSEKILTAVANNETSSSNSRYESLLSDFQSALTKGIQEAIARVSLEAQVRGLQAQKEVLQQQLDNLNVVVENMQAQYDTLVAQTEMLQRQLIAQQEQSLAQLTFQQEQSLAQQSLLQQQSQATQDAILAQSAATQAALQAQITGNVATQQAAAAGFIPGKQSEFYFKLDRKDGRPWSEKSTWTTSRNSPKATQFANLLIQNLRDDGASITKVALKFTGALLEHGPFGFTDAKLPLATKSISVGSGKTSSVMLYAGNNIGGDRSGTPEPDGRGLFNSAKDYAGKMVITVTYSNGTTENTDDIIWTIRKNKT